MDGVSHGISTNATFGYSPDLSDRGDHTLVCKVADDFWTVDSPEWKFSVGQVFYVDAENGDDSNDGLSKENAKREIQAALDCVEDGDKVLVAPGVYSSI